MSGHSEDNRQHHRISPPKEVGFMTRRLFAAVAVVLAAAFAAVAGSNPWGP